MSSRFTFFTFWYHFQNSTRGAHPAYWGVGSRVNWKPQAWRPDKNRTVKSTQNCCLNFFNFLIFYQKTSAGGLHQQSSQSDGNPLSTSPFNMRRMYLTSELSPSLSTPGWTTAVKSSSKIWTTFEWYTLNLRSTSTQTYLYVVMVSQRYGRIGCTSCFMCGAD